MTESWKRLGGDEGSFGRSWSSEQKRTEQNRTEQNRQVNQSYRKAKWRKTSSETAAWEMRESRASRSEQPNARYAYCE